MADLSFLDSFFHEQQNQQERAGEESVFLWNVYREKKESRRA